MIDDRFLPRVWTDKGYYYPIFSELGITYENKNLPFTKENLKDINWAFRWHFNHSNENVDMEYINTLEQCTGLKDKNDKLIYDNDFIRAINKDTKDKPDLQIGHIWVDEMGCRWIKFKTEELSWNDFCSLIDYDGTLTIEVIGNIHKNADLLEAGGEWY